MLYFSVSVGIVTVTDPLGPVKHGYVIYDDGVTDYEECPVYDWIEIALLRAAMELCYPSTIRNCPRRVTM
jgi:hypothetical protein